MPIDDRTRSLQSVLLVLLGVICVALVAAAVLLQVYAGEQPCPWCIILRYDYLLVALLAFVALFLPHGLRLFSGSLILLLALIGSGISGYLVYLQYHPLMSCGRDVVQEWTDAIPLSSWCPTLFQATGLCGATYPPVLGLTTPQWSLVTFVLIVIGVAAAGFCLRRRQAVIES